MYAEIKTTGRGVTKIFLRLMKPKPIPEGLTPVQEYFFHRMNDSVHSTFTIEQAKEAHKELTRVLMGLEHGE